MGDFLYLERFRWFDEKLRQGRCPNAATLAERFELSRKQAQRTITHLRDRFRKFYLARMRRPRMLAAGFTPRPVEEWRAYCEGAFGIFQGKRHTRVTLQFNAHRARWVREQLWHPRQQIQEQLDGGLILRFPVADFREVKLEILRFGADCEVLAPEALRREVATEIGRMAKVYTDRRSPPAPADGADAG